MAMKWSYFKPEFSGKSEEDFGAHLLKTIDWMNIHNFQKDQRVRRFPLTLAGEARLWNQSIHSFQVNWGELQKFHMQLSKIGNSMEQLFHVWITFNFNENVLLIDAYVQRIGWVTDVFNYGVPDILEVFRNT